MADPYASNSSVKPSKGNILVSKPDAAFINSVFGDSGALALANPGYEKRDQQIQLATYIGKAFMEKRHMLAEAPTGTGKSFAYLVPLIAQAVREGKKAIVCTANIALQEQIVAKDLPFLKQVLPFDFKYALLKGKNNYICRARISDYYKSNEPLLEPKHLDELDAIEKWAEETELGDVSELNFQPSGEVWSRVNGSPDCDGERCASNNCSSFRARNAALRSNVIIMNYHVLFANVQLQRSGALGFLPQFDCAVFDEAHEMAEIARDFFGYRLGLASFRRWSSALRKNSESTLADELFSLAQSFFKELNEYAKQPSYKARIKESYCINSTKLLDTLEQTFNYWKSLNPVDRKEEREFESLANRAMDARSQIELAMDLQSENEVFFIETSDRGTATLQSKMIDPSQVIREFVFDSLESGVATSATLTTGGSRPFEFILKQLGVEGNASTVSVESPFDYSNQGLLVVPKMRFEPTNPAYPREVAEQYVKLIEATKGRILGLFTSYRVLNEVVRYLRAEEAKRGTLGEYRILVQGELPRTKLVQAFRDDIHSVLLGVSTLWTGVDVQGEALSCLAIDRLPFPNPMDPVIDVLTERDQKGWFFNQSIPRAVITFKQGFGRLIRSKTDTGVVVVFDNRIVAKPYGRQFIKALPNIQQSDQWEHVEEFIRLCDEERITEKIRQERLV